MVVANLPDDLRKRSVEERKTLFIQTMLPLVLQANEDILFARMRLLALAAKPEAEWLDAERAWLLRLADQYGAEEGDLDELFRRVDIVPPSVAIAQAAWESGWGTSRFALEGNALFGQWTYRASAGLLPSGRVPGAAHYVRTFDGLSTSVSEYIHNLNTHDAYAAFRNRRAFLREQAGALDPFSLVNTLLHYSEQRHAYVAFIRNLMKANGLAAYDGAILSRPRGAVPVLRF